MSLEGEIQYVISTITKWARAYESPGAGVGVDLVAVARSVRRGKESSFEALSRVLLEQALAQKKTQRLAGKELGVSQNTINYKLRLFGLRKKDKVDATTP